jgi:hypothetical protein
MMMTFRILFLIKINVYRVRRIHHGQLEEKKKKMKMKNEASVVNEHFNIFYSTNSRIEKKIEE